MDPEDRDIIHRSLFEIEYDLFKEVPKIIWDEEAKKVYRRMYTRSIQNTMIRNFWRSMHYWDTK